MASRRQPTAEYNVRHRRHGWEVYGLWITDKELALAKRGASNYQAKIGYALKARLRKDYPHRQVPDFIEFDDLEFTKVGEIPRELHVSRRRVVRPTTTVAPSLSLSSDNDSDVGPGGCGCTCAGCDEIQRHCGNVSRGCRV